MAQLPKFVRNYVNPYLQNFASDKNIYNEFGYSFGLFNHATNSKDTKDLICDLCTYHWYLSLVLIIGTYHWYFKYYKFYYW